MTSPGTSPLVLLERACAALSSLVRAEYGEKYTLAEIAETWGEGITPEQVEALRLLEDGSAEPGLELVHNPVQRVQV
jgi:hypothetical protein